MGFPPDAADDLPALSVDVSQAGAFAALMPQNIIVRSFVRLS